MIDKRLGVFLQLKAAGMGHMLLNTFFFDLGEWKAELCLTRSNPAAGRPLKGAPPAHIAVACMGDAHGEPGYPASPR